MLLLATSALGLTVVVRNPTGTRLQATMEAPEETRLTDWRSKYLVEPPRSLEKFNPEDLTKFDKFKASYMGKYNEVGDILMIIIS